jgi:predicted nucleic acid-binding protein
MSRAFFYDTWAFAALLNKADAAHSLARKIDRTLQDRGYAAVTTDYVVDETVTLLHSAAGARAALLFLDLVLARETGADLLLLEISGTRRERAVETFRKLAPREPRLSFTDASSFAAMAELGIELAFTADRHFQRAGHAIRPLVVQRGSRWQAASFA